MKIINLTQFRALPEGTLFLKYQPCCFEDLRVKGATWEHDFVYGEMGAPIEASSSEDFEDKLEEARLSGASLSLDFNSYGRDGLYEKNQLFAVYEKSDVEKLIEKLHECIKEAYP